MGRKEEGDRGREGEGGYRRGIHFTWRLPLPSPAAEERPKGGGRKGGRRGIYNAASSSDPVLSFDSSPKARLDPERGLSLLRRVKNDGRKVMAWLPLSSGLLSSSSSSIRGSSSASLRFSTFSPCLYSSSAAKMCLIYHPLPPPLSALSSSPPPPPPPSHLVTLPPGLYGNGAVGIVIPCPPRLFGSWGIN